MVPPGESLLCLIRHGATAWNASGRLQGRQDVPLSPEGEAQIDRLARALERLAAESGGVLWRRGYTSPLRRAVASMRRLERVLGVQVELDPELVERAFGAMEGLTRPEADLRFPGWRDDARSVPGLEEESGLRRRAVDALTRLARAHPGEGILIVSHGAFLNSFLSVVSAYRFGSGKTPFDNGAYALVRFRSDPEAWEIEKINQNAHLLS